jgi:hypothetical protein
MAEFLDDPAFAALVPRPPTKPWSEAKVGSVSSAVLEAREAAGGAVLGGCVAIDRCRADPNEHDMCAGFAALAKPVGGTAADATEGSGSGR